MLPNLIFTVARQQSVYYSCAAQQYCMFYGVRYYLLAHYLHTPLSVRHTPLPVRYDIELYYIQCGSYTEGCTHNTGAVPAAEDAAVFAQLLGLINTAPQPPDHLTNK